MHTRGTTGEAWAAAIAYPEAARTRAATGRRLRPSGPPLEAVPPRSGRTSQDLGSQIWDRKCALVAGGIGPQTLRDWIRFGLDPIWIRTKSATPPLAPPPASISDPIPTARRPIAHSRSPVRWLERELSTTPHPPASSPTASPCRPLFAIAGVLGRILDRELGQAMVTSARRLVCCLWPNRDRKIAISKTKSRA